MYIYTYIHVYIYRVTSNPQPTQATVFALYLAYTYLSIYYRWIDR